MKLWYYNIGGRTTGPVEEPAIRALVNQGRLTSHDRVWSEGMVEWVSPAQAGFIPRSSSPPPLPIDGSPVVFPLPPIAPALAPVGTSEDRALIRQDDGPFLFIGQGFSVPGGSWAGTSIVSPGAFYLLKVAKHINAARYGGGVVGMAAAQLLQTYDTLRSCDFSELPGNVKPQLDKSGSRKSGDVIVLPKPAITQLAMPRAGGVMINLGQDQFILATGLFNNGKIRAFLSENGWTLA